MSINTNNIEAFEELKKAFHYGGNAFNSLGIHNNIRNNNTDMTGTFAFGQDLEKLSGESG